MANEEKRHEVLSSDGEVDFVEEGEPSTMVVETKKKPPIALLIGLPLLALGAFYAYGAYSFGASHVTTDDAYVTSDVVPVNARVQGIVDEILVADNQQVKVGQLLVKLDDSTYRAQLAEAEANLAVARASAGGAGTDVDIAQQMGAGQVTQAQSAVELEASNVSAARASVNEKETAVLSARASERTSESDVIAAQETVKAREAAARRVVDSILAVKAQVASAEAAQHAAEANLRSAEAAAANANHEADRAAALAKEGAIAFSLAESRATAAATARAAVEAAGEQVSAAKAMVEQKKADVLASAEQVKEAEAGVAQARALLRSAKGLVQAKEAQVHQAESSVAVTRENVDAAESRRRQALGKLNEALAAPKKASVSEAGHQSALAKVQQAAAALKSMQIALKRTEVRAPIDGIVTRRTAQIGQQLSAGQPVMVLIPATRPWIIANFKETQLAQLHPGLAVDVHVDALPGKVFKGHVDSISSGTGATFALLPPDNATGNFTKVVQRVPVKIILDDQPNLELLKAGLSSSVSVALRD
jgi:membrane fusion protein (multidrug efflux system)